jgi:hypothetical protein
MNKHSIKLKDGTLCTRNSETQVFTYCLVVKQTKTSVANEHARFKKDKVRWKGYFDQAYVAELTVHAEATMAALHVGGLDVLSWHVNKKTADKALKAARVRLPSNVISIAKVPKATRSDD